MRSVDLIVIHCSATPDGEPLSIADVDAEHARRGFVRTDAFRRAFNPGLSAIGWHFVINVNGATATGRHLDEIGAGHGTYGARAVGLCLVGTARYTAAQWAAAAKTVRALIARYQIPEIHAHATGGPGARAMSGGVCGHGDLHVEGARPSARARRCPGFDVGAWLARNLTAEPAHRLGSPIPSKETPA